MVVFLHAVLHLLREVSLRSLNVLCSSSLVWNRRNHSYGHSRGLASCTSNPDTTILWLWLTPPAPQLVLDVDRRWIPPTPFSDLHVRDCPLWNKSRGDLALQP